MKRFYQKWKTSGELTFKHKYKVAKSFYRKSIFKSQCQLEERLSYHKNSKALIKYINARKKNSAKIDSIANENNKTTEDPFEISNLFNKYFHSVYTNSKTIIEDIHHLPNNYDEQIL